MPGIWLDDERSIHTIYENKDLIWVKTAPEAIALLKNADINFVSLDHDLGEADGVGNGYDVASFIEEAAFRGEIPPLEWNVHTANPAVVDKMTRALENADRFWRNKSE